MKLQSVQVLRGIAALLVVLYHARGMESQSLLVHASDETPFLNGAFANGFGGVDLFFAISGFIMVYVTHGVPTGPKSATSFLFARATRIYPLWWFCAAIVTAYMMASIGPALSSDSLSAIARDQEPGAFFLKSFFLIPQAAYPVPSVGWTLIHEMYFYVVFALMLAVLPRAWWPLWLLTWCVIVIAGTVVGLSSPIAKDFTSLALHPMTLEFIFGAGAGLLAASSIHWRPGLLTVLAATWLAAAICLHGTVTEDTLLWTRVLWFGLPSAVLVYAVASLDDQKRAVWLLPAGVSVLVILAIFQAYGLGATDPFRERFAALCVALIVGTLAALMTLWAGWVGGRQAPDAMRQLGAPLNAVFKGLADLGEWSYSLYLVHIMVLTALRVVFERLGQIETLAPVFRVGHDGRIDNIVFAITCVVLSIAAAKITYTLIEKPLITIFGGARTWLFRSKRAPVPAE